LRRSPINLREGPWNHNRRQFWQQWRRNILFDIRALADLPRKDEHFLNRRARDEKEIEEQKSSFDP
jgi:hypothetical protein